MTAEPTVTVTTTDLASVLIRASLGAEPIDALDTEGAVARCWITLLSVDVDLVRFAVGLLAQAGGDWPSTRIASEIEAQHSDAISQVFEGIVRQLRADGV